MASVFTGYTFTALLFDVRPWRYKGALICNSSFATKRHSYRYVMLTHLEARYLLD
jgi:hypothetical protein